MPSYRHNLEGPGNKAHSLEAIILLDLLEACMDFGLRETSLAQTFRKVHKLLEPH